jgi:hypothetical protein
MTKYARSGVALLVTTLASHVHAQAVIEDPRLLRGVLSERQLPYLGPGNPYTDAGSYRLATKLFHEKICMFQFPEDEDVIPLPLPNDGMTVP